ncbi:MAG: phosphoribosylglycinamide formyltransferase [Candidatus Diapherotrites archaeon]
MGKICLAVLASTRAADLDSIVEAINNGTLNAEIKCLVSNKENAGCVERAKKHGIEVLVLNHKEFKTREDFDKKVSEELEKRNIDLIVLIGYMLIMSDWFVKKYKGKIMNVHPSLLPAFAGGMDKNVHQAVLDSGVNVTGATIHFVTEELDSGPIIMQKSVSVDKSDTVETLKAKVQKLEQEMFPKAIQLYAEGKLKIEGNKVRILK